VRILTQKLQNLKKKQLKPLFINKETLAWMHCIHRSVVNILSSFGEVIKVMKKVIGSCRILTAQNTLNLVQENFLKIVVAPPITVRLLFFFKLSVS